MEICGPSLVIKETQNLKKNTFLVIQQKYIVLKMLFVCENGLDF